MKQCASALVCLVAGAACGTHDAALDSSATTKAGARASVAAASPPRPSSVSRFTALIGNLQPRALSALDVGRLDASKVLRGASLLFKMTPAQTTLSRLVLDDLQNPLSPNYHKWLSPEQYAARFGASNADMARAAAWLASEGLTVQGPARTATRLFFTGTVGQIEQAFRTEVHQYDVRGERHFALSLLPSVPTELAPYVLGLRGLHDFHPPPPRRHLRPGRRPDYLVAGTDRDGGAAKQLSLAPADVAALYDLNALYSRGITGAGQKIAVLGFSDFNDADIAAFRSAFGLDPSNLPTRVLVPNSGAAFVDGTYGWFGEAELDLEWAGAVARDASLSFVFTGKSPGFDIWEALYYAVDQGEYPIISASYADCEQSYAPSDILFTQTLGNAAAMEGITIVAASGDWGPAQCDASDTQPSAAARYGSSAAWPASIPTVVGVGGTELDWGQPVPHPSGVVPSPAYWAPSATDGFTVKGYIPETGWNEMSLWLPLKYFWGTSGGGESTLYPMPDWQRTTASPGRFRRVPDVAMTASASQVGYVVSCSWTAADGDAMAPSSEALSLTGGTSVATPVFSGILALVNQSLAATPSGLGNPNPVLYALSKSTAGTAAPAFHDITTGNNMVPCTAMTPDCPSSPPYQFGYEAGVGYDMVTGLGSVDAYNLALAWKQLSPTSTALVVAPSGTTEGSAVALTATVASTATSNPLTGSVTFYFRTVDAAGIPDLSVAATAALLPTAAAPQGGSASATAIAPPGLLGKATVVASYGGDANYLASWSAGAPVVATSSFVASPPKVTLRPNGKTMFTTSNGVTPVTWDIVSDTTCDTTFCAAIVATSGTSAELWAGPADGNIVVAAIDSDGAEARVDVVAAGMPIDAGPPPRVVRDAGAGGGRPDAGAPRAAGDGGAEAGAGAGGFDAATADEGGSDAVGSGGRVEGGSSESEVLAQSRGCSCAVVGQGEGGGARAALAAALLSAYVVRRRRRVLEKRAHEALVELVERPVHHRVVHLLLKLLAR